jgi:hypothetical protein
MKTPFIRSRTIIPGRNTLETDHMPLPLLIETPPKTQNEVLGESSVTTNNTPGTSFHMLNSWLPQHPGTSAARVRPCG